MNSAISPTTGASGVNSVTPSTAAGAASGVERPRGVGAAVSLQAIPSSPPPEVLDEMAQASAAYDRLSAQGRTLHFAHDVASRRTAVEVRDRSGQVLRQISIAQALDVAAGAPLE